MSPKNRTRNENKKPCHALFEYYLTLTYGFQRILFHFCGKIFMIQMHSILFVILTYFTCLSTLQGQDIALVIHGGAGNIYKKYLPDSLEVQYRAKLRQALEAGYAVLEQDGSSMDAVKTAINILEDSPLFNAGKGAVFTNSGTVEMDASVMDGKSLNAGSVAGVKHIRNPINAAIEVMRNSPHVMMTGTGAEAFARLQGLRMEDSSYFYTEKRHNQLLRAREKEKQQGMQGMDYQYKFGTVGAVALDKEGNISAGTSTGGMTNKRYGRVGDAPIIGAGTYANNNTCGISGTGHGEYFIRSVVAHDISALMAYAGLPLQQAADKVIHQKLIELGGEGGVIGLDADGNIMMSFNSNGMYRGYIKERGQAHVFIFRNE
jgi:beta-aspartyl-peptidase (threonine type)